MLCITGLFVAAGLSKFYVLSVRTINIQPIRECIVKVPTHHLHWGLREAYDARLEYDSDVKSTSTCSLLTFVMARFV